MKKWAAYIYLDLQALYVVCMLAVHEFTFLQLIGEGWFAYLIVKNLSKMS